MAVIKLVYPYADIDAYPMLVPELAHVKHFVFLSNLPNDSWYGPCICNQLNGTIARVADVIVNAVRTGSGKDPLEVSINGESFTVTYPDGVVLDYIGGIRGDPGSMLLSLVDHGAGATYVAVDDFARFEDKLPADMDFRYAVTGIYGANVPDGVKYRAVIYEYEDAMNNLDWSATFVEQLNVNRVTPSGEVIDTEERNVNDRLTITRPHGKLRSMGEYLDYLCGDITLSDEIDDDYDLLMDDIDEELNSEQR